MILIPMKLISIPYTAININVLSTSLRLEVETVGIVELMVNKLKSLSFLYLLYFCWVTPYYLPIVWRILRDPLYFLTDNAYRMLGVGYLFVFIPLADYSLIYLFKS